MRYYKEKKEECLELTGITCDVCGNHYPVEDWAEIQAFYCFEYHGCYGSDEDEWGDGITWQSDQCQHCLAKIMKPYSRKVIGTYMTKIVKEEPVPVVENIQISYESKGKDNPNP